MSKPGYWIHLVFNNILVQDMLVTEFGWFFRHTLIDDDTDDEADHVLLYMIELF